MNPKQSNKQDTCEIPMALRDSRKRDRDRGISMFVHLLSCKTSNAYHTIISYHLICPITQCTNVITRGMISFLFRFDEILFYYRNFIR